MLRGFQAVTKMFKYAGRSTWVYTYSTLQDQIQVGVITNSGLDWTNENSDFDYLQMKKIFSSLEHSNRLWGPPSLRFSG